MELCRHRRLARKGGGVEPRRRTDRRLGSGDAACQQHRLRRASPLDRSDALGRALHASESFLGDRGEVLGRCLAMRKRAGSCGGGRSVNWAWTMPQAEQHRSTPLTHLDSRQACTHTATGREVDGEALRGQGEPRRPGVFGIATAWCNWVGSATSCWGRLRHGVRIKVNLKPTIK